MSGKQTYSKLAPKNVLAFVFHEERRSSILLLIAAALALFLANSAWSAIYFDFFEREFTLGSVTLDLQHWINEGLMAIFFLVVVLEVKREFIDGELSTWRKASFPVVAAVGGMLVPALLYSLINPYPPQNAGWAIPMATDIAIAIGLIGLLGKSIPKSLRVFLLALAIVDDVGSIIVIGLFYSQPTNMFALLLAAVLSLSLLYARTNKYRLVSFTFIGIGIWYCLLVAGISGTMAGVIVAAMAPLTTRRTNAKNLQASEIAEDVLLPLTAYLIVPLFVFANAGIDFSSITLTKGNGLGVFMGVIAGLLLGKPIGILGASWLATRLKISNKPSGTTWTQITGIGFVAGIGFTISLLIADLAFSSMPKFQNAAVLGVFVASVVSGIIGIIILRSKRPIATMSK